MSAQELPSTSQSQTEDDKQVVSPKTADQPPENGDDDSSETNMTMEERKARLEQLRARMVSFLHATLGAVFIRLSSLADVHESKQAVTRRGVCKGQNYSAGRRTAGTSKEIGRGAADTG
jgi:hypothetical protein